MECLDFKKFEEKFEIPWRKLIQFVFKKYKDGMVCEKFISEDTLNKLSLI